MFEFNDDSFFNCANGNSFGPEEMFRVYMHARATVVVRMRDETLPL